jgi:glyoxylase-like metal-dependent hydrolase (beta-lactamase superfamily II)
MRTTDMTRLVSVAALAAVCVVATAARPAAQQSPAQQAPSAAAVSVLPVQGSITMITAGGENIAVQVGKNGVVLVDTPPEALVPQVLAEIRKLTDKPVLRYIVNTSADRIEGNAALVGPAAARGSGGAPFGFVGLGRPSIIAHDAVLNRLSSATPAPPAAALPTTTYFMPSMDFYANDEPIMVYHQPAAHSDGDSVLLFRKSDVIVTGNIYTPGRYPIIDTAHGGTVDGLVKALGTVLALAVPEAFESGGTRIVPGTGRIGEETDVAEFRDMVVIIKDRIQDAKKKGQTLEQVKAARLSRDFDLEYNASQADADRLVEAIYTTLPAPPPAAAPARGGNARPAGGRK